MHIMYKAEWLLAPLYENLLSFNTLCMKIRRHTAQSVRNMRLSRRA
jgi:hypothetical protein